MCFPEIELLYFDTKVTEICHKSSIGNKSALVQVIAFYSFPVRSIIGTKFCLFGCRTISNMGIGVWYIESRASTVSLHIITSSSGEYLVVEGPCFSGEVITQKKCRGACHESLSTRVTFVCVPPSLQRPRDGPMIVIWCPVRHEWPRAWCMSLLWRAAEIFIYLRRNNIP